MLIDWDIEQYATRTMQKEGFEAGAKWARECIEKEMKSVAGMDLRNILLPYRIRFTRPALKVCKT